MMEIEPAELWYEYLDATPTDHICPECGSIIYLEVTFVWGDPAYEGIHLIPDCSC